MHVNNVFTQIFLVTYNALQNYIYKNNFYLIYCFRYGNQFFLVTVVT